MLKIESYKKGIIVSTGLNIIVKAILLLNTVIIAWYFGTSVETDLYFYIFSTVFLIAGLVNGMDLAVILPEGMHLQEETGKAEAVAFYNFFGLSYFLVGILLFLVLFFFSVPIYSSISSFKSSVLSDHINLLLLSSALPLLVILSNYYTAVLTTLKYFTAPLIASGIAQSFVLLSLLIFHTQFGIISVLIGMVAGYLVNIGLLLFFMYHKLQWRFHFSAKYIIKRVRKNLAAVQLGNMSTFAFNYGIIVVLSGLPTGVYSAYNYSMQILNIPNNFIVAQAAAVAGIKFNELAAQELKEQMNSIFSKSTGILLFLIVPFCCLSYLYADTIVKFLFLRGGFTRDSAEKVTHFIKYMIFLSPCFTVNTFSTRIMTAAKKVSQAFFFQLGFNVSALFLIIFITGRFGEDGFIISMLMAYYFYVSIITVFLFRWLMPFINYLGILKSMGMVFLFNLPLLWITYQVFGEYRSLQGFLLISVGYYAVALIVNHFININKAIDLYFSNFLKTMILKIS